MSAFWACAADSTIVALDGPPLWQAARVVLVVAVCVGVALATRRAPRSAGAIAALVGAVVATAGGTIGISHLTRTGLSLRAVAGLIALAGGLTATALGAAALLRSVRTWRRLLSIPIAAVMTWAVVKPLWAAVYATNVPRPELGSATPADRGMKYEEAAFTNADGVKLPGWYVPSSNRAAVVLLHGASSTRSNVLAQAAVLARRGYGVLLFDARGHSRSGGRAMEFGWYGELDTSAAVEQAINRLEFALVDLLTESPEPLPLRKSVAAAAPRPVLLIAAGRVPDEQQAARSIQAASPESVDLWVVPGSGHTGARRTHPEEWEERVVGFLDRELAATEAEPNSA